MKKIIFAALLLVAISAHALITKTSKLGPAAPTLAVWAPSEQAVSLASSTVSGFRNCLSKLSVSSNANVTVRILDGGTTVYHVVFSTPAVGATVHISERWDEDDMCGTAAAKLHIKLSTAALGGSASTQQLNYSGFSH